MDSAILGRSPQEEEILAELLYSDEDNTVLKALWRDITDFLTSLSGVLGDQSLSASYFFWQKPV